MPIPWDLIQDQQSRLSTMRNQSAGIKAKPTSFGFCVPPCFSFGTCSLVFVKENIKFLRNCAYKVDEQPAEVAALTLLYTPFSLL